MKIHSDIIEHEHIAAATRAAGMRGVYTEKEERRGSRQRSHSFDVTLRGNSTRRPNFGTGPRNTDDGYAATWDEWGMFINALFQVDPDAVIGQYSSLYHFERVTGGRFEALTAPYSHGNHNFDYNPRTGVQECKYCEATFNRSA